MTPETFGRRLIAVLARYAAEGVPYKNQGTEPAFGLDCVGAILAAAKEVGLDVEVAADWKPTGRRLDAELRTWCERVGFARLADGDLVVMGRNEATHAGAVYADPAAASGWRFYHANRLGVHRQTLILDAGRESNAAHPVRGFFRVKPELVADLPEEG